MTARSLPVAPGSARPLERLLALRIPLRAELLAYAGILAVAFAFRFWDLGANALHHDESIHAHWSWRLLQGDYRHSPIFHGPFYYHVQAATFFIFGASDYTARLSAAIFGMGIVALPLLLRRRLGHVGTATAMLLLAVSPTVVYFSRFFREDVYMAFFVLLMVVAMWRYIGSGRDRWLYVFAGCFFGAVLTKEGAFLTVAVFLVFLDLYVAALLAQRTLRARDLDTPLRRTVLTAALAPWAWLVAAFWPFLRGLRERMDWGALPRAGDVLVLLGTITLPLLTPVLRHPLEAMGIVEKDIVVGDRLVSRLDWQHHLLNNMSTGDGLILLGLFTLVTSAAAFVGLQWRPKVWAIAFGIGAAVYLTLMTSFWTNLDGLVSGPWGSIDYWTAQQSEHRADQPWFYYYMLMPVYEFLPLVLAAGGAWWAVVRGDAFSRFLVFWLVGQALALSWGAEKMPWLTIHIAVPTTILAAWTVARAWRAWRGRKRSIPAIAPLAALAPASAAVVLLTVYLPGGGWPVRLVAAVALGAAGLALAVRWRGWSVAPIALCAITVGGLLPSTVYTSISASFQRGDVPKDLLIYTQSSPYIPAIMRDIDRLAEASGQGKDLPVLVDATDSFAWPWVWYLRDYRCVSYPSLSSGEIGTSNCRGRQQPFQVLLVNEVNRGRVQDQLLQPGAAVYGEGQQYPHRWWFDERYKWAMSVGDGPCTSSSGNCGPWRLETWKTIAEGVFNKGWIKTWFLYWRDRDPDRLTGATGERACNSCGSVNGIAFFPANFDRETGKLTATTLEAAPPGRDAAGRLQFGGLGVRPGLFLAPVDIATDGEGNLYVVDSQRRRVQKFDSAGNYLAGADVRRDPANVREDSQPWGITVAPDGRVIVADTFGWRVRVFDAGLQSAVLQFGEPPDLSPGATPGPYSLFGPRDVAVDARGRIWLTDTGHDRVVVYDASGTFLFEVGGEGDGPGEFNEPVGIAIDDTAGAVYVADMENARIVVLDLDGRFQRAFPVQGWGGRLAIDKPYLTVLRDSRIAVSFPTLDAVRIYTPAGEATGEIRPADVPLQRPYGVVESSDGKLWVVEGGASRVRQFDVP
jgi:predicted membrane-bound mannosyltransferase